LVGPFPEFLVGAIQVDSNQHNNREEEGSTNHNLRKGWAVLLTPTLSVKGPSLPMHKNGMYDLADKPDD
jgi:hypothetical protein